MLRRLRDLLRYDAAPIALVLILALCIGWILADDYGMGTDEYINAKVGWDALRALGSYRGYLDYFSHISLAHHGPSYFMVMAAASRLWTAIFPGWHLADGRHFTNFLAFLLAVGCLYALCRRVVSRRAALITSLLFLLQPVLLGVGFINQKDTPFMAFFLASLVVGLTAADRLAAAPPGESATSPALREALRRDRERNRRVWRVLAALWAVLFLAITLDLFVVERMLAIAKRTLDLAHEGRSWAPFNVAFRLIAEDAWKVPVEPYMRKLEYAYWSYGRVGIFLAALGLGIVPLKRAWPETLRHLVPGRARAYLWIAAAGALMGFLVSIRPLGGFVAILVSLYAITRLRERAAGPLLIYWIVAGVVCYLTWPYLWSAPLEKLYVSVRFLVDFKPKIVLYQGAPYPSEGLPWHFVPVLITLQMSEPVIPLFVAGLILGLVHLRRRPEERAVTLLLLAWLLVVGIASSMPGAVHFNGFRHVLFLLPPVFYFAAFSIEAIFDRVRREWVSWALALALLAPGAASIASLHPYEYASFNSYAGGIQGAYGNYDTEYWCTSYRRTVGYLNTIAVSNAVVFSRHSLWSALPFGRPDLVFTNNPKHLDRASYVLVCKHYPEDILSARGRLLFTESHGSAVFAELWDTGTMPAPAPEATAEGEG